MSVILKVWGDYACFSRPDAGKVERFSYPIITPSAARAVFDAIYWKPKFRWRIERIEMLTVPRYLSLMRNEVKDRISSAEIEAVRKDPAKTVSPLFADATKEEAGTDQKGRTQRQTMALKKVAYRLHATPQLFHPDRSEEKSIVEQFQRRARAGKCRWQPYLGCREFAAYFELVEGDMSSGESAAPYSETIGMMLYDVFDLTRPIPAGGSPALDAPAFVTAFKAEISNGVLDVPAFDSKHVFRPRDLAATWAEGGVIDD